MATKRATAVMSARKARPVRRAATLKKRIKTFIALFCLGILSVIAAVAIFVIIKIAQIKQTIPSVAEIGNFQPSQGTHIYTSDGELLAILASEHRRPVKLEDISQQLIDATIATEDSRFYEHRGVDYHGVVRAVLHNVLGGVIAIEARR